MKWPYSKNEKNIIYILDRHPHGDLMIPQETFVHFFGKVISLLLPFAFCPLPNFNRLHQVITGYHGLPQVNTG